MNICKGFDSPPSVIGAVDRIIAMGDVHGDFQYLIELLKIARVLKENNVNNDNKVEYEWIGGKTHVVQLGDQIDNCRPTNFTCGIKGNVENDKAEDAKIIDFMNELDEKAKKSGGRVISLLGNHEVMNVVGELSYVSYENLHEFDGEQGRRKAFSPSGEYGKKIICTRPAAIIIGSNLFVHAGIVQSLIANIPKLREMLKKSKKKVKSGGRHPIENFIMQSVNGLIHKNYMYSLAPKNSDYVRFWDSIFMGRVRPYSEANVHEIIVSVNKLPIIRQVFDDNIEQISSILQTGGSHLSDIEVINLAVKKWLSNDYIDEEYAQEMMELNSLFWTRILGSLPKNQQIDSSSCSKDFKPILKLFNVRNMIVAHTPQFDANQTGINATCVTKKHQPGTKCMNEESDNNLWRIDIGGAESFDKFDSEFRKSGYVSQARRPQVLEITNDTCFNILK